MKKEVPPAVTIGVIAILVIGLIAFYYFRVEYKPDVPFSRSPPAGLKGPPPPPGMPTIPGRK